MGIFQGGYAMSAFIGPTQGVHVVTIVYISLKKILYILRFLIKDSVFIYVIIMLGEMF